MKVRTDHWELLLNMAERTPEILTNKFNGAAGKAKGHAMWQTVANKLNGLGFGEKTTAEWRRALTDWKSKTKAKAAKLRFQYEGTGGGPSTILPLSDLEKRLIALMGHVAVEGDIAVVELGLGSGMEVENELLINQDEEIPQVGQVLEDHTYLKRKTNTSNVPSKRRRIRENTSLRMSKDLIDMNKESLNILSNIDTNIASIAESLKIIANHYQK